MLLVAAPKCAAHICRRNWPRTLPSLSFTRNLGVSLRLRQNESADSLLKRTRNIGIIAHIDAGKTTTTERILYYSGYTRRIGDVDDGSTVTDFLPAERARGITIQSAAITFHWPPISSTNAPDVHGSYTINLIDTPGHADFTFEVLRSLRILDGAVCILDGVAGVEAQTEKVWHQAKAYNIPNIIYVNKLDRDGAAFGRTVKEIAAKLHSWPAVCQIPWFENGNGRFQGVVDVVSLQALRWQADGDGKSITSFRLPELQDMDPKLAKEAIRARVALIELLTAHDDFMVERALEVEEEHLAISGADILTSLRHCLSCTRPSIVPVFAGASFRNIGVQPLVEAITALLPSPNDVPAPEISIGHIKGSLGELASGKVVIPNNKANETRSTTKKGSTALVKAIEACALAFKVVNDTKRGILVYVRVYQGSLTKASVIFNTNLQISERIPRLLKMYANDAVEIDSIPAGQIGVITGLKYTRTGDTLITCAGMNPKVGPPPPLNELQLRPIEIPPPVFFASIEPQSLSEEKPVADALAVLLREDPSLQLSMDEDSGQTLLSGMGELHLEIARDRLIQDMKAKATMGKIEIGYREALTIPSGPETVIQERSTAGKTSKAGSTSIVSPLDISKQSDPTQPGSAALLRDGNLITTTILSSNGTTTSEPCLPSNLHENHIHTALQNGALAALARGPKHAFPMHSTHVELTLDPEAHLFGSDSSTASISSAARQATTQALRNAVLDSPSTLMEPVMNVVLTVDEASLGTVVHDISSARGGHILSLDDADEEERPHEGVLSVDTSLVYAPPDPWESPSVDDGERLDLRAGNKGRLIRARVPLREMVGYLKVLRSQTGGRGSFVMSVDQFERMGAQREKAVLKELKGAPL